MIHNIRPEFNKNFSPEKHQKIQNSIEQAAGVPMKFRLSESPIFLDKNFKNELLELVHFILNEIEKTPLAELEKNIPPKCYVPKTKSKPDFVVIDFGICQDNSGNLYPGLIELQGFPSIFAYQHHLADSFKAVYPELNALDFCFNQYDTRKYLSTLGTILLGQHQPENVVLLEIFPEKQKTGIDFSLTEKLWGIPTVCLTSVIRKGKKLYYAKEGNLIPIHRIFNRVIFDELFGYKDLDLAFDLTQEVDVEWCGHPNWFFMISKALLPSLKHPRLPKAYFAHEFPKDAALKNYILKPLYSFSGQGVNLHPTKVDIDSINHPEHWILQEKVKFAPVFEDINGEFAKAELRILCVNPEGKNTVEPIINLVRMTKSEMANVDHNRLNKIWTGSSIAFFEP